LADDPEVVYESVSRLAILERTLKAFLRNASRIVLGTSGLARTAEALWLEMEVASDIVVIGGERDQSVQRADEVHDFAVTTCCARDENAQIDIRFIVNLYRRSSRDDHNREHCNDTHHHSGDMNFHWYPPKQSGGLAVRGGDCANLDESALCVNGNSRRKIDQGHLHIRNEQATTRC
jgi:hypothetical protein